MEKLLSDVGRDQIDHIRDFPILTRISNQREVIEVKI